MTLVKEQIEMVEVFHKAGNHPVMFRPIVPLPERMLKRADWIQSELKEFRDAAELKDFIEMMDALCDLQYFLNGTIVEMGSKELFDACFAEVHASNMSKFCRDKNHAIETTADYLQNQGKHTYYEYNESAGVWVVYFAEGEDKGKIAKALGWRKPDLKKIILDKLDEINCNDQN